MRRFFAPLLLILLLGFSLFTTVVGINFGVHWDEANTDTAVVKESILSERLLPGFYSYPSMFYYLMLAGLVPDVPHVLSGGDVTQENVQYNLQNLAAVLDTHEYLIRTRIIFAVVTLLSLVFVFCGVRFWLGDRAACVAAVFLAGSWELMYHARWIAPDGLAMSFVALTLMCVLGALHYRASSKKWLYAAVISVGLAAGSKYPSALVLIPVLLTALVLEKEKKWGTRLLLVIKMGVVSFISYLITTPGTLLDPIRFLGDLRHIMRQYATEQWANTVAPGFDHLGRIFTYLGGVVFSPYLPIALFVSALALVGIVDLMSKKRTEALILLSFPVIFIVYISTQRLMIVRNLLPLFPFCAVFASLGFERIYLWARSLKSACWLSGVVIGLVVIVFLANGAYLVNAAYVIRDRGSHDFMADVVAYVRAHPHEQFLLSPQLVPRTDAVKNLPSNIATWLPAPTSVVFRTDEVTDPMHTWDSNQPRYFEAVFGPREINSNYYPVWSGDSRIVILPLDKAKKLHLAFLESDL